MRKGIAFLVLLFVTLCIVEALLSIDWTRWGWADLEQASTLRNTQTGRTLSLGMTREEVEAILPPSGFPADGEGEYYGSNPEEEVYLVFEDEKVSAMIVFTDRLSQAAPRHHDSSHWTLDGFRLGGTAAQGIGAWWTTAQGGAWWTTAHVSGREYNFDRRGWRQDDMDVNDQTAVSVHLWGTGEWKLRAICVYGPPRNASPAGRDWYPGEKELGEFFEAEPAGVPDGFYHIETGATLTIGMPQAQLEEILPPAVWRREENSRYAGFAVYGATLEDEIIVNLRDGRVTGLAIAADSDLAQGFRPREFSSWVLDSLTLHSSREEVKYVLGEVPTEEIPEKDTWIYCYSAFRLLQEQRGEDTVFCVTVVFRDDVVQSLSFTTPEAELPEDSIVK